MTLGITDITRAIMQLHILFTKTRIRFESGQEVFNCRLFLKVTMKLKSTPNLFSKCMLLMIFVNNSFTRLTSKSK